MNMEDEKKHYWLYVLLLEENKYYVGITAHKDPQVRINQHFNGYMAAQWTKKYKPLDTIETISLGHVTKKDAESQEKKRTLQYMKKYGYENVRGADLNYSGSYTKVLNRFWKKEDFNDAALVLCLVIILVLMFLLK